MECCLFGLFLWYDKPGDKLFCLLEIDILHGKVKNSRFSGSRNIIQSAHRKWPKAVPYLITKKTYEFDLDYLSLIQESFDEIHEKTCVRFYPKTENDTSYMNIILTGKTEDSTCSASVGKRTGQSTNVYINGCNDKGSILHEILHALGKTFWQVQPDYYILNISVIWYYRKNRTKNSILYSLLFSKVPQLISAQCIAL